MSDTRTDCRRFEDLLIEGGADLTHPLWVGHLTGCASCRAQRQAHQLLIAAFAHEPVPELSPTFERGLQRQVAAGIEVVPLRGWRLLTLAAYAAVTLGVLRQLLGGITLPPIPAPWVVAAAYVAVPLSFLLAVAASKRIPARRATKGIRSFAL